MSAQRKKMATISVDKKIVEKAQKRARKAQLSVSDVVRVLLEKFASGELNIGSQTYAQYTEDNPSPRSIAYHQKLMQESKRDIKTSNYQSAQQTIDRLFSL